MSKRIYNSHCPEFIEAVLLNDKSSIEKFNPGYSPSMIKIIQTMASSYKLDANAFNHKYRTQGHQLRKQVMEFVDTYPDLVTTTYTANKGPILKKRIPGISVEIKENKPREIKIPAEKIEAKEVLNLLADTIKTIQMLVEKL